MKKYMYKHGSLFSLSCRYLLTILSSVSSLLTFAPTDSGGEPLGIYRSSHYSSASEIEGLRIRTTSGYDHPYDVASLKIQTERVSTGEQFDLIGLIACVCVEKYNFYFNIIFYKKDLASLNSTHDSSFALLLVSDSYQY